MTLRHRVPLTRRGWILAGGVIAASVLGLLFGARALNAVVAPAVVALVVAVWRVSTVDVPTPTREAPQTGTHGDRIPVSITLGGGLTRICRVTDEVSDGLDAAGNDTIVPGDEGLGYAVTLAERGRHTLGPVTVAVRDLLGLAQREMRFPNRTEVTAHPRVHPVSSPELHQLAEAANITLERERHEFDRLREYRPEDSLRDIHWKSSAKRSDDDFIVKEFVSERDRESVMISGEAVDGADDALAEAMASLASALVEHGARVGVHTVHGTVDPIGRSSQLDRILAHLATLTIGHPASTAKMHVRAGSAETDEVVVRVDGIEATFGDLRRGELAIAPELDAGWPGRTPEVAD